MLFAHPSAGTRAARGLGILSNAVLQTFVRGQKVQFVLMPLPGAGNTGTDATGERRKLATFLRNSLGFQTFALCECNVCNPKRRGDGALLLLNVRNLRSM